MHDADPGQLDYLVIGHVTQDRAADGALTVGGTAAYAARTAWAMGCRTGVLTSAEAGLDLSQALPDIAVRRVAAPATTTFENRYTPDGRVQFVRAVAAPLTPADVPPAWRNAAVVHLGPVAGECDPALASLFPAAFLGLTPQGWMRRWDEAGRVRPAPWERAAPLLRRADAVVLSLEDVGGDEALIRRWAAQTRVLAVTQAADGCVVHAGGDVWRLPAPAVVEIDPTGSGDIFAAVFFVRLWRGDDPPTAARRANAVAAASVTRRGLLGTPRPQEFDGSP